MTVKRLLRELDSRELTEWIAFDKVHPLPNTWRQTARTIRAVMASSGKYKSSEIPEEEALAGIVKGPSAAELSMIDELRKLERL